jgi:hypothetical protein
VEEHPQYQIGRELDHWPTTDELVALTRTHRQGEAYPTLEWLIENLPVVLRGLYDDVLSCEDEAYHIAYVIASLIEVIEHIKAEVAPPDPS